MSSFAMLLACHAQLVNVISMLLREGKCPSSMLLQAVLEMSLPAVSKLYRATAAALLLETAWLGAPVCHLLQFCCRQILDSALHTICADRQTLHPGHVAGPKKTRTKKSKAKAKQAGKAKAKASKPFETGQSATVSPFATFATCPKPCSSACMHAALLHIIKQTSDAWHLMPDICVNLH